jgi:uncharacterized membrane protein
MNFNNESKRNDQRFEAWFRNHYLYLILGFLFIFISLPILAPVLLRTGMTLPAKVIYWVDSFFCHQLPFRSWFLFGAQPYYPLASAGIKNVISFEEFFHPETMDFKTIRFFTGNSTAGFKMAICQRDIAMYVSLFAFGILFAINHRKIKKLPLIIWIIFGVIPLGFDGITQYLGTLSMPFFEAVAHESTPLLRTITGGLFGLFTGWYIFPALDSVINKNISG